MDDAEDKLQKYKDETNELYNLAKRLQN